MAAAVLTGVASGVQGARLARQAPDGAVPVETGTSRRRRRRRRPRASSAASASWVGQHRAGVALVAVNAVLAQVNHSHPAKKRALVRSNSPLWIGTAVTTAAAALDQARRRRA